MKTSITTILLFVAVTHCLIHVYGNEAENLSRYKSTERFFALPESFDPTNVEECRMVVRANPDRFESHMLLATALARKGKFSEALKYFQITDEMASMVDDREVLAELQYEEIFSFVLYAEAERRFKRSPSDLKAIRMCQQALGMDPSALIEQNRMTQLHALLATAQLLRGADATAKNIALQGKDWAEKEGQDDYLLIFGEIITKTAQSGGRELTD